jgi:putative flippase GtrA
VTGGNRILAIQAVKFLLTGLLSSACYAGTILFLVEVAGSGEIVATVVGFVAGTAVSWAINSLWTFEVALQGATLQRFVAVTLLGLGLNVGIMKMVLLAGLDYRLGVLLILVVVPVFNFCGHRWWTYQLRRPS